MSLGSRALAGQPQLPYTRHASYAGADVLLNLTFLNSASVPTQPTSIAYRVDSLTCAQPVIAPAVVAPTGSSQTIQLPGSVMQLSRQVLGEETLQVLVTAVIPDANASSGSITVRSVTIIDLVAIALPS